ncbi:hypothetical protein ACVK1X_006181 [Pseudomonas sp. PvR086]|nr:hypothetical protein C1X70_29370 [Pseudomonas sp. FW305-53]PMY84048.1 hypothetical protein C1X68_26555 [Pseudomonas sp. FW303-C2]PMY90059.1 hypothetical protein C1X67_25705 [Pseudomonas sp. FW305-62]PNA39070.1 hypothetical protein C1X71_27435 [Pseudomonas sp. FW306-2-2C-A10BC]PNA82404.1 hypothetical protein C1X66_26780 [Pseudomonas sp. MPR-R3B]PNB13427.1 hypothetical protein C1X69_26360 [Pseudomonas sp. FW305-67]PZW51620.1 hypothetical protein F475_05967 [Pseudomonas sp. URMO17WK12:I6]
MVGSVQAIMLDGESVSLVEMVMPLLQVLITHRTRKPISAGGQHSVLVPQETAAVTYRVYLEQSHTNLDLVKGLVRLSVSQELQQQYLQRSRVLKTGLTHSNIEISPINIYSYEKITSLEVL